MKHIYIFSSFAGETGERVIKKCLALFDDSSTELHRKSHLCTLEEIRKAIEDVKKQPGLIVYTLVAPDHANFLRAEAERYGFKAIDLITPIISEMKGFLNLPAKRKPGLRYKVNEEYIRELEPINFTLKHDDGQLLHELHQADIVLVGVSRTSKTPLSIYLATKGYMVANVPLIEEIDPPKILFAIDQNRIVGLTIDVRQLINLRMSRLRNIKESPHSSYTEYEMVKSELAYAKRLYRENPKWLVVDMTNKAIEEVAADIMQKFQFRVMPPCRNETGN